MAAETFYHPVKVHWGDCDPARIAYTARIPSFALDSINAFWEHVLDGDGWYQMEIDRNIGTPFVHMSIDFLSPITPRHELMCEVRPVRVGNSSIEFTVTGRQNNRISFQGRFICVFTIADQFKKTRPPENIREAIAPYLAISAS